MNHYPRGWIIWTGMVVWSLAAACGLARSGVQLFAARMGVGAGEAAISTSLTPAQRAGFIALIRSEWRLLAPRLAASE